MSQCDRCDLCGRRLATVSIRAIRDGSPVFVLICKADEVRLSRRAKAGEKFFDLLLAELDKGNRQ